MAVPKIAATLRATRTKGELRRIRDRKDIPAVIYGKAQEPIAVSLAGADYRKAGRGHKMLDVALGDRTIRVMVQDVGIHPVDREVLHIDLHAVALNESTVASVPIHMTGFDLVEKRGGLAQQQLRELPVAGLPGDIPDAVSLDIGHLNIGDTVHARDVVLPAGVTLHTNADEVVVAILRPSRAVDDADGEAAPAS